jgi:carbonic anhydrase
MTDNKHQSGTQSYREHESEQRALGQRRYPSLWLACDDPVMDQALTLTRGLDSARILRSLRSPASDRRLIDDVSLDLTETLVRHRRIVQIIVCGHACCSSAPNAVARLAPCGGSSYERMLSGICRTEESNRHGQIQVIRRIRELRQSPLLAMALSQRKLTIHGLFYLAETGMFTVFNYPTGQFVPATLTRGIRRQCK